MPVSEIVRVPDGVEAGVERERPAALLPELAKAVSGAALAFWLIAASLAFFLRIDAVYFLAAFGLLYSLQASYYAYMLRTDPEYRIRSCGCANVSPESTERVLASPEGSLLGIPNGLIGVGWYCVLMALLLTDLQGAAMPLATLALLASGYLAWVMVARVRGLCSLCVYTFTLNALILWQLFLAGG